LAGITSVVRRLALRLDNLWHESTYGISTRGVVDIDNPDSVYYAATPYSSIRRFLEHLEMRPSETFVDIGCGKGRVVCCAARYELAQVIGIDISEDLCAQARTNAERLRGRKSPITIYTGPAQEFDYSKADALFLFNPFGADTLDQVLTKIRNDKRDQPVRFAYAIPTHKHVFSDHTWLEEYQPAAAASAPASDDVAFFRTK
jgi:cyclopropane fatty-acyl-phospholipid synthase-like methyltransferase